jgi:hypothetical protein
MTNLKDSIVRHVQQNSKMKIVDLTDEFINAAPEEKEAVLAGLDFEKWLKQTCQECLCLFEKR